MTSYMMTFLSLMKTERCVCRSLIVSCGGVYRSMWVCECENVCLLLCEYVSVSRNKNIYRIHKVLHMVFSG